MEKPGSDDWKNFSWKKLTEQAKDLKEKAKDLGDAAGREISALLKGEKTYTTETMAEYKTRRVQEDEEAKNALYKKHGIPQKSVPPAMPTLEAPRVLSAVEKEMDEAFYATPAGSEVNPRLRAGILPERPLSLEEVKARQHERMLLDALAVARTKKQENDIYARLYAAKNKQPNNQQTNP